MQQRLRLCLPLSHTSVNSRADTALSGSYGVRQTGFSALRSRANGSNTDPVTGNARNVSLPLCYTLTAIVVAWMSLAPGFLTHVVHRHLSRCRSALRPQTVAEIGGGRPYNTPTGLPTSRVWLTHSTTVGETAVCRTIACSMRCGLRRIQVVYGWLACGGVLIHAEAAGDDERRDRPTRASLNVASLSGRIPRMAVK